MLTPPRVREFDVLVILLAAVSMVIEFPKSPCSLKRGRDYLFCRLSVVSKMPQGDSTERAGTLTNWNSLDQHKPQFRMRTDKQRRNKA